jgi:hypothetical protein
MLRLRAALDCSHCDLLCTSPARLRRLQYPFRVSPQELAISEAQRMKGTQMRAAKSTYENAVISAGQKAHTSVSHAKATLSRSKCVPTHVWLCRTRQPQPLVLVLTGTDLFHSPI